MDSLPHCSIHLASDPEDLLYTYLKAATQGFSEFVISFHFCQKVPTLFVIQMGGGRETQSFNQPMEKSIFEIDWMLQQTNTKPFLLGSAFIFK